LACGFWPLARSADEGIPIGISRRRDDVQRVAGVKPIRFHDLRHSFASNFILGGGSIYKLQRLLGHTSVQMTERYSHLSPEHLADATELLDFGTHSSRNVRRIETARSAG
jgi:integrase